MHPSSTALQPVELAVDPVGERDQSDWLFSIMNHCVTRAVMKQGLYSLVGCWLWSLEFVQVLLLPFYLEEMEQSPSVAAHCSMSVIPECEFWTKMIDPLTLPERLYYLKRRSPDSDSFLSSFNFQVDVCPR